jgi:hypothetical protein
VSVTSRRIRGLHLHLCVLLTTLVLVGLARLARVENARSSPEILPPPVVAPPWFTQVREPYTAPPGRDDRRRVRPWGRCARRWPRFGVVPPAATPVVESPPVHRYPLPPEPRRVRRHSSSAPARTSEQSGAHVPGDRRSVGLNPRRLDPQQSQEVCRTWAITYLCCLRHWWSLVCGGRPRYRRPRSSPNFLPARASSVWLLLVLASRRAGLPRPGRARRVQVERPTGRTISGASWPSREGPHSASRVTRHAPSGRCFASPAVTSQTAGPG